MAIKVLRSPFGSINYYVYYEETVAIEVIIRKIFKIIIHLMNKFFYCRHISYLNDNKLMKLL